MNTRLMVATALTAGAELIIIDGQHIVLNNVDIEVQYPNGEWYPQQEKYIKVGNLGSYEGLESHKEVKFYPSIERVRLAL